MHSDNENTFQLTLLSESMKMNNDFRSYDVMKTVDNAVWNKNICMTIISWREKMSKWVKIWVQNIHEWVVCHWHVFYK